MKIALTGSKEFLSLYVRDYLKSKGHDVFIVHHHPEGEGEISFKQMQKEGLLGAEVVINFPEKQILSRKKSDEHYKKEFMETRIRPTQIVKEAILKEKVPPKLWISFSSVSCYPKDKDKLYNEDAEFGEDLTSTLVRQWEDAALLYENKTIRCVIPRVGLVLSNQVGLLPEITPFFKFGLGVIIGNGSEPFPWVYYKDLCLFLVYMIGHDEDGVFNVVAPQMINSKVFSEALAQVMQRTIYFKLPEKYFQKRLGDVAEIILAQAKIYPKRLLKSGFNFRYPAIYPDLVDTFSQSR